MSSHVEQIKERLSIVDVTSSYVKLEKAGINFRAKCPFHNEKTPSFFVSPSRNSYYCFGCGAKGDIFSFVEQFEGTDFKGALKILADRAGVTIKPISKNEENRMARLYRILEDATLFFERTLASEDSARLYLAKRGIKEETISFWRLGYAPTDWRGLLTYLKKKGYKEEEIEEAGLIKRNERGSDHYDRFRGRVMFPIMDSAGRVIAYSGRLFPEEDVAGSAGKYINSPETSLYEKSRILYGYHQAKLSIRKHDFSILAEGQMDVVLSHQAGYTNSVASSGTALTMEQVKQLSRISENLVMAFDADAAGISAGEKGVNLALALGMNVKVVALPAGKDPADIVKESGEAWRKIVRDAKHVVDFYLDYLSQAHGDIRKKRLAVGQTVLPYIASIPNKMDQAHFVSRVSARLSIAEEPIWESVRNISKRKSGSRSPVVFRKEELLESRRSDSIRDRLYGVLLWQEKLKEDSRSIDVEKWRAELKEVFGKETVKRDEKSLLEAEDRILFEIEHLYENVEDLDTEVCDLYREFKKEQLKDKYKEALMALKDAEKNGVSKDVEKALNRCRELSEALGEQVKL